MKVRNTLLWTIIYTSLIYRKNVVYCTDNGIEEQSSQQSEGLSLDSNEDQQENYSDGSITEVQESLQTSPLTGTDADADSDADADADADSDADADASASLSVNEDQSSTETNRDLNEIPDSQPISTTALANSPPDPGSSQSPDETGPTTESVLFDQHTDPSSIQFTGSTTHANEPDSITQPEGISNPLTALPQSNRFNLEHYPDLKSQLHALNRLKLVDLLIIVVNKVMSLEDTYKFESCVNSYLNLCKNCGPVGININVQDSDKFDRTVDADTNTVTFTCKKGQPFSLVKQGDRVIYHTLSPREFLKKVEMIGESLFLYDLYGNSKVVPIAPIMDVKTVTKTTVSDSYDDADVSDSSNDPNQSQTGQSGGIDSSALVGSDQDSVPVTVFNTRNIDIFDHSCTYSVYKVVNSTMKMWTPLLEDQSFKLYYQKTSEGKNLLGLYSIPDLFVSPASVPSTAPSHLNYVTLDVENLQNTSYIDYEFEDSDKVHLFYPKTTYMINNVKKGEVDIWKNDDDDISKYPSDVEYNGSDEIFVGFDTFYLSFKLNSQGEWVRERRQYATKVSVTEIQDEPSSVSLQEDPNSTSSLSAGSYLNGDMASSSIGSGLPEYDASSSFRGSTYDSSFQSSEDQDDASLGTDVQHSESMVVKEDETAISAESAPAEADGGDSLTPSPEAGEDGSDSTAEVDEDGSASRAEANEQSSDLTGGFKPTTPPANETFGSSY